MQRGILPRNRPRVPLVVVQGAVALLLFAGVWEGTRGSVGRLRGFAGFWQQATIRSSPPLVHLLDRLWNGPRVRSPRTQVRVLVPRVPVSGILLAGFSLPGHPWVQVGAAPEAPVSASLSGTVTAVRGGTGAGEVQERTALGIMTYGGVDHPVVRPGERVRTGQLLALVAPPVAGEAMASLRWQVGGPRSYVNPLSAGSVP